MGSRTNLSAKISDLAILIIKFKTGVIVIAVSDYIFLVVWNAIVDCCKLVSLIIANSIGSACIVGTSVWYAKKKWWLALARVLLRLE